MLDDNPTLPPLPPLSPLLSRPNLLTVDLIQDCLASVEQAEDLLVTKIKRLAARRNKRDARKRQHRRREDEEWAATQRKRKAQDDRIQAHRQEEDAALEQSEHEVNFHEVVSSFLLFGPPLKY